MIVPNNVILLHMLCFILSVICLISISVSRKQRFQNPENNYVPSVHKSHTPHTAENQ